MSASIVVLENRALLAVDPGARGCGVALFRGGALAACAYVRNPAEVTADVGRAASAGAMALAVQRWAVGLVDDLAVEWPRVYATAIRRGASRGDPNDLLPLAGVDAALAALLASARCSSYAPFEWKGQMSKDAMAERIMSRLAEGEFALLEAACDNAGAKAHNIVDAVGIGLHHLGRLAPRRALA